MKYTCFQSICAYEIGDYVTISDHEGKYRIENILAIHSVRDGNVWFQLQLDNGMNIAVKPSERR